MPKKSRSSSIDLAAWRTQVRSQFSGLDPNDPSVWPAWPRNLLLLGVVVLVVVGLWYAWLGSYLTELETEQRNEAQLRDEFTRKVGQAVNLDLLKAQLEQVQQYVTQLEKQLPSKAEMDQLLSDINQAGLGRSLQFELFRPGEVNLQEYYAELPIEVRVSGTYEDIGLFAADIAALSRIVTINNLSLSPVTNRPDLLTLDATAKTFRYLDPDELLLAQQQKGKK